MYSEEHLTHWVLKKQKTSEKNIKKVTFAAILPNFSSTSSLFKYRHVFSMG